MGHLGRFARKYGLWLLLACVAVTVPAVLLGWPLKVSLDASTVFPAQDPTYQNFRYFQENFGVADIFVAVNRAEGPEADSQMDALVRWMRGTGYFTAAHRMQLPPGVKGIAVIGFPKRPSTDQVFCKKVVQDVRDYLARAGTKADLTGGVVMATESLQSLNRDMNRTVLVSLGLTTLLLLVSFGDVLFPIFAMIPLCLAILLTMGLSSLLFGEVNLLTASLPTTLLGMGIDYAVYLRTCRREFRMASHDVWHNVYHRVGFPILVGVLTTSGALLALCTARLPFLSQMGIVGGVGMLLIYAFTMLCIPVLVDWRERLPMRFEMPRSNALRRLAIVIVRQRRLVILLFVIGTIPLALAARHLQFDMNPKSYQDPHVPSIKLFQEFSDNGHISFEPIYVATANRRVEQEIAPTLRSRVGAERPFGMLDSLSEQLDRGMTPETRLYVGKDKALCAMLYPGQDPYAGDNLRRLVDDTRMLRAECGERVTAMSGMPLLWDRMMALAKEDMLRTGLAAGALILVILTVMLRTPRHVAAAMVPLAGSLVWMLGVMQLAGFKFSLSSAASMPLVLGLGIDYGVHIVHRLRHGSVSQAVAGSGRAIIVAGGTTAFGFFALCAASNAGLVNMGLATGVGLTSAIVWSMIFLPAFAAELNFQRRKRLTAEGAEGERRELRTEN